MQMGFDFGESDNIAWVRDRLRTWFGRPGLIGLRTPIGQLVKSLISGRTRDEVSLRAYHRLIAVYPRWAVMAGATTADVEAVIGAVTYAEVKARHLGDALRTIAAGHPQFDLAFLARRSVTSALEWLERLPGVGRKVAASALNFSTLRMPAFVIDTHVVRILQRFGFVRGTADTRTAYDAMTAILYYWTADELAELHVLMKSLGQTVCRANQPCCHDCPISRRCRLALHRQSIDSG